MSKNSVLAPLFGSPGSPDAATNLRCEQCHQGTVHHESQMVSMTPGCGGCHRDHRGREASLTWLPDSDCTQCHSNLKAATKEGKSEYDPANAITGFADGSQGHPDFPSLAKDPGRLKFNHALHMRPGQVIATDQVKPWTLGRIADETTRKRYASAPWQADKSDGATVVLDCASCHRLDAGDLGIDPRQQAGGPVDGRTSPAGGRGVHAADQLRRPLRRLSPPHLRPQRQGQGRPGRQRAAPAATRRGQGLRVGRLRRGIVGKNLDPARRRCAQGRPQAVAAAARQADRGRASRPGIGQDAAKADEFLFKADVKRADGYLYKREDYLRRSATSSRRPARTKKIEPVMVNSVWLAHSKFSHVSHRAADCRICHPNAYAFDADGKTPTRTASTKIIRTS